MRLIKIVGLTVFLTGISLFLASFFLADYKYSPQILEAAYLNDGVKQELILELKGMEHSSTKNPFAFIGFLKKGIDRFNARQLEKFKIQPSEISAMVDQADSLTFRLSILKSVYPGEDEVSVFKRSSFYDYSGWLDGRIFGSEEQMGEQLSSVADNIQKYEVINKRGIDRYLGKELLFSATKSANNGIVAQSPLLFLLLTFGLSIFGGLLYFLPDVSNLPGIKNNGIFQSSATNGGWIGVTAGTLLILFYILLYFFPEYMTTWVIMVDPVSVKINGGEAGRFFLYGFMYTVTIVVMGVRMLIKYKGNKYQQIRTVSVMFFQTTFAFLIPEILVRLNKPYFDFKNIWPLDYDFFFVARSIICNYNMRGVWLGYLFDDISDRTLLVQRRNDYREPLIHP